MAPLAIRSQSEHVALGDQLPAVLDSDESPSAAVAAELFLKLADNSALWQERLTGFLDAHRPLLALTHLPSAGLAAVLATQR